MNFIITTPEPVFFKSIQPGIERETGIYISSQIKQVLEEVGSMKFTAIITDNASNMKAAWKEISKEYPHIACIGCASHCLNLLINDIMKLSPFKTTLNDCKSVIKYIKNKHVILAFFEKTQKEKYGQSVKSLKLPSNTRWGAAVLMFESFLSNKEALQATVISQELTIDRAIKNIILEDETWNSVEAAYNILSPIAKAIIQAESDSATLSVIPYLFSEMRTTITEIFSSTSTFVSNSNQTQILNFITDRYNFCLQPIHFAAHLLDPRFRGSKLQDDEFLKAVEYISKLCSAQEEIAIVMADLAEYRTRTGFWSSDIVWASINLLQPRVWWQGLCATKKNVFYCN